MKLFVSLLIFLFSLLNLTAQSKWSFGAGVQGGFSGYSSSHSENHLVSAGTASQNFGYQEKRQPSVGLGIWWSKKWDENWSLSGGLDYVWSKAYIVHDFSTKLLNGTPLSYSLSVYNLYQQQLQFPLSIKYSRGKEEWSFKPFFGAGIQLNFLVSEKREQVLTLVNGLEQGNTFLTRQDVNFRDNYRFVNRAQAAAHVEMGVKNDDVSLGVRVVYPLQKGAIYQRAERRNYICCLDEDSVNPFAGRNTFFLLTQTSLVFQYRLF